MLGVMTTNPKYLISALCALLGLVILTLLVSLATTADATGPSSSDTVSVDRDHIQSTFVTVDARSSHPTICDNTGHYPFHTRSPLDTASTLSYLPCTQIQILNSRDIYVLPIGMVHGFKMTQNTKIIRITEKTDDA